MHPMLNVAVKAARRAGNIIQRASLNLDRVRVERKHHNDFVSEVDRASEEAIIETILEAYPKHAILAEESGAKGIGSSEYEWIIDPLDGTTNFLHGHPQYCISIALAFKGQVQQAVVFDPNRNDLFTASRGVGAFLNNRRIRVSPRFMMNESVIGTGFPVCNLGRLDLYMAVLKEIVSRSAGVRREGAAALDLCNVACGRTDGFWEFNLKPWDIAAGSLIIQEAGGLVTDCAGEQDWLDSGDIVAGNAKILAQLLAILSSCSGAAVTA